MYSPSSLAPYIPYSPIGGGGIGGVAGYSPSYSSPNYSSPQPTSATSVRISGSFDFFVDVEIHGGDSSSPYQSCNVGVNVFSHRDRKEPITGIFRWSRRSSSKHLSTEYFPDIKSNTYQCSAADLSSIIECEVQAQKDGFEREFYGTATITFGPIDFDATTKQSLLASISANSARFPAQLLFNGSVGKQKKGVNIEILLTNESLVMSQNDTPSTLIIKHSAVSDFPTIQMNPLNVSRLSLSFKKPRTGGSQQQQDSLDKVAAFMKLVTNPTTPIDFNSSFSEEDAIVIQVQMGSRVQRDLFYLAHRAFTLRNFLVDQKILQRLTSSFDDWRLVQSITSSDITEMITNMRREIDNLTRLNSNLTKEKEHFQQESRRFEHEIADTVEVYTRIIEQMKGGGVARPSEYHQLAWQSPSYLTPTTSYDISSQLPSNLKKQLDNLMEDNAKLKGRNALLSKESEGILRQLEALQNQTSWDTIEGISDSKKPLKEGVWRTTRRVNEQVFGRPPATLDSEVTQQFEFINDGIEEGRTTKRASLLFMNSPNNDEYLGTHRGSFFNSFMAPSDHDMSQQQQQEIDSLKRQLVEKEKDIERVRVQSQNALYECRLQSDQFRMKEERLYSEGNTSIEEANAQHSTQVSQLVMEKLDLERKVRELQQSINSAEIYQTLSREENQLKIGELTSLCSHYSTQISTYEQNILKLNEQVSKLLSEKLIVEAKLEEQSTKYSELHETLEQTKELKSMMAHQTVDRFTLEQDLKTAQSKLEFFESRLEMIEREKEQLQQKVSVEMARYISQQLQHEDTVRNSELNIHAEKKQNFDLTMQIATFKQTISSLQAKISQLQDQGHDQDQLVLTQQHQQLVESKMIQLQEMLRSSENSHARAEQQLEDAHKTQLSLEDKCHAAENQIASLQRQLNHFNSKVELTDTSSSSFKSLQHRAETAERLAEDKTRELNELSQKLRYIEEERQLSELSRQSLMQSAVARAKESAEVEMEMCLQENQLEKLKLNGQLAITKDKNAKLISENEKLIKKLEEVQQTLETTINERNTIESQKYVMKVQLDNHLVHSQQQAMEVEALKEQIRLLQMENLNRRIEFEEKSKALHGLEAERQLIEQEIDRFKSNLRQLKEEKSRKVKELTIEKRLCEKQIILEVAAKEELSTNLQRVTQESQRQLTEERRENQERLEAMLNSFSLEKVQAQEASNSQLEELATRLQNSIVKQKEEKIALMLELEGRAAADEERAVISKVNQQRLEEEKSRLLDVISDLQAKRAEDIRQNNERNEEFNEEIAELSGQLQQLKQKYADLENVKAMLVGENTQLASRNDDADKENEELIRQASANTRKISVLVDEVNALSQMQITLISENDQAEKQNGFLVEENEKALSEKEEILTYLIVALAQCETAEVRKTELTDEKVRVVNELQQQITLMNECISDLTRQIDEGHEIEEKVKRQKHVEVENRLEEAESEFQSQIAEIHSNRLQEKEQEEQFKVRLLLSLKQLLRITRRRQNAAVNYHNCESDDSSSIASSVGSLGDENILAAGDVQTSTRIEDILSQLTTAVDEAEQERSKISSALQESTDAGINAEVRFSKLLTEFREESKREQEKIQRQLRGEMLLKSDAADKARAELEDSQMEVEKQLQEKSQVCENMAVEKETLEAKLSQQRSDFENLEIVNEQLKNALQEAKQQSTEAQKQLDESQNQLDSALKQVDKTAQLLDEATKLLDEAKKQDETEKEQKEELLSSIIALQTERNLLLTEFSEVQEKVAELEEEVRNTSSNRILTEQKNLVLIQEIQSLSEEREAIKERLEEAQDEQEDEKKNLDERLAKSQEKHRLLVREWQDKVKRLVEELTLEKSTRIEVEQKMSETAAILKEAALKEQDFTCQKSVWETQKICLSDKIGCLEESMIKESLQIQDLKSQLQEVQKQLEEKVHLLQEEKDHVVQYLQQLLEREKSLNRQLRVEFEETREKSFTETQERIEKLQQELVSTEESRLIQLEGLRIACEKEREQLVQSSQVKMADVIVALKREHEELRFAQNNDVNRIVSTADTELDKLREQIVCTYLRDFENQNEELEVNGETDLASHDQDQKQEKSTDGSLAEQMIQLNAMHTSELSSTVESIRETHLSALIESVQQLRKQHEIELQRKQILEEGHASSKKNKMHLEAEHFGKLLARMKTAKADYSREVSRVSEELKRKNILKIVEVVEELLVAANAKSQWVASEIESLVKVEFEALEAQFLSCKEQLLISQQSQSEQIREVQYIKDSEISQLKAHNQQAIDELRRQHADEIEDVKASFARELEKVSRVKEEDQAKNKEINDLLESHRKEIEGLQTQWQKETQKIQAIHAEQITSQNCRNSAQIAHLEEQFASEKERLVQINSEHQKDQEKRKNEYFIEMETAREEQGYELERMNDDRCAEIEQINSSMQLMKAICTKEVEEAKGELDQFKTENSVENQRKTEEFENKIQLINEKHLIQIKSIEDKHSEEIKIIVAEHATVIEKLNSKIIETLKAEKRTANELVQEKITEILRINREINLKEEAMRINYETTVKQIETEYSLKSTTKEEEYKIHIEELSSDHLNSTQLLIAQHVQAIEQLRSLYGFQVEQGKDSLVIRIEEVKEQCTKESATAIKEIKNHHLKVVTEIEKDHRLVIQQMNEVHIEDIQKIQLSQKTALETLETDQSSQIESLKASHNQSMKEARIAHSQAMEEMKSTLIKTSEEIKQLKVEDEARIVSQKKEIEVLLAAAEVAKTEREEFEATHLTLLEEQKAYQEATMIELQENHEEVLQQMRDDHSLSLQLLRNDNTKHLQQLEIQQSEIGELNKTHKQLEEKNREQVNKIQQQLRDLQDSQTDQLLQLNVSHKAEIEKIAESNSSEIQALNSRYESEIASLRESNNFEIEEIKSNFESEQQLLTVEIDQLKSDIDVLKTADEQKDEDNNRLREQLNQLKTSYEKEIVEKQNQNNQIESSYKIELVNKMSELKQNLEEKHQKEREELTRIHQTSFEEKSKAHQIELSESIQLKEVRIRALLESLNETSTGQVNQQDQLREELDKLHQKEINNIRKTADKEKEILIEKVSVLTKGLEEGKILQEKITEERKREIQLEKEAIMRLTKDFQEAKSQENSLSDRLEKAKREVEVNEKKAREWTKKEKELEGKLTAAIKKVEELQKKVKKSSESNNRLAANIKEGQKCWDLREKQLSSQFEETKKQLAESIESAQRKIAEMKQEIERLERENGKIEEMIKISNQQVEAAQQELGDIKIKLEEGKKNIQGLEKERSDQQREIESLKGKLSAENKNNERLQKNQEGLIKQIEESKKQNTLLKDTTKKSIDELKQENAEMKKTIVMLKKESEEVKKHNDQCNKEKCLLNDQLASSQKQVEVFTQNYEGLKKERNDLASSFESKKKEIEVLRKSELEMKKSFEDAQNKYEEQIRKTEKLELVQIDQISSHTNQSSQLKADLMKTQSELEQNEMSALILANKCNDLSQQLEAVQKQLTIEVVSNLDKISNLQMSHEQTATSLNTKLQSFIEEKESFFQSSTELNDILNGLREHNTVLLRQLEDQKPLIEQQIKQTEQRLTSIHISEVNELKQQCSHLQITLKALEEKLVQTTNELADALGNHLESNDILGALHSSIESLQSSNTLRTTEIELTHKKEIELLLEKSSAEKIALAEEQEILLARLTDNQKVIDQLTQQNGKLITQTLELNDQVQRLQDEVDANGSVNSSFCEDN